MPQSGSTQSRPILTHPTSNHESWLIPSLACPRHAGTDSWPFLTVKSKESLFMIHPNSKFFWPRTIWTPSLITWNGLNSHLPSHVSSYKPQRSSSSLVVRLPKPPSLRSVGFDDKISSENSKHQQNRHFPDTLHLEYGGPPCKASHHPMKDWSFSALLQSDCALWRRGCEPQPGSAAHLSFHLLLWSMLWDTLFHGKEK